MDISIISKLVLDLANSKDVVFDSEITEIVKKQYPSFNDAYKNILIKQLRDMGIIYTYDVNMFKAYRGRVAFTPFINSNVEGKLNTFRSQNDFAISYFDTSIYNQLSSLQSVRSYLFIGVEAFAANYLIDKMEKEGKRVVTSNDLSKLRKLAASVEEHFLRRETAQEFLYIVCCSLASEELTSGDIEEGDTKGGLAEVDGREEVILFIVEDIV